jgi:hypothetical protein
MAGLTRALIVKDLSSVVEWLLVAGHCLAAIGGTRPEAAG